MSLDRPRTAATTAAALTAAVPGPGPAGLDSRAATLAGVAAAQPRFGAVIGHRARVRTCATGTPLPLVARAAEPADAPSTLPTLIELEALDPGGTVELSTETIAALIAEDAAPPALPAGLTAPGPIATAAEPASSSWSDRPAPPPRPVLTPPYPPFLPASRYGRHQPRFTSAALWSAIATCVLIAALCYLISLAVQPHGPGA